jgi:DNA-binding MarR family transcriptional regulator
MSRRRALEDDLGFLLAWASALIVKASNQAMAPHGLKVRAYSVLSVVCDEPGGITQRQVGDDVGLDPSQVVALVDELESRGLVARTADPNDRRNKLVVATKRGRDLRKQAQERTAEVAARYTASVKPQAVERMRKMLNQMVFSEVDEVASSLPRVNRRTSSQLVLADLSGSSTWQLVEQTLAIWELCSVPAARSGMHRALPTSVCNPLRELLRHSLPRLICRRQHRIPRTRPLPVVRELPFRSRPDRCSRRRR